MISFELVFLTFFSEELLSGSLWNLSRFANFWSHFFSWFWVFVVIILTLIIWLFLCKLFLWVDFRQFRFWTFLRLIFLLIRIIPVGFLISGMSGLTRFVRSHFWYFSMTPLSLNMLCLHLLSWNIVAMWSWYLYRSFASKSSFSFLLSILILLEFSYYIFGKHIWLSLLLRKIILFHFEFWGNNLIVVCFFIIFNELLLVDLIHILQETLNWLSRKPLDVSPIFKLPTSLNKLHCELLLINIVIFMLYIEI